MSKDIKEIVMFLQKSGYEIEATGPDLWHVRLAHPSIPERAIHMDLTSVQLTKLQTSVKRGYKLGKDESPQN